ncbi:hypothetical protein PWEIH_09988 [Listeria weihenstephanensis FSL R9-0317]|uniref:Nucleotidyl transferase AbiEii/AbiGii toxin family protein n=1 Tax=Listeria weihenstephanensis TaxID=1006155 RepID=A0A1S7FS09_9LIST|nr:nucleotidyl transferase AbiEii/AbiGii toxin family protein [Listeria weihenstephanensis]AQY50190.1 hypothetical protein UE46_03485 [Listeria weihenstephanensis]EUJ38085.1 hypothetical protein PWEIH_09988 [Listeria weihenstephanensis FSL R9-0317]
MRLYKDKETFEQLIIATSAATSLSESIIEKDYYVSMILRELSQSLPNLVFKGGTSLSKAYQVIDRFSEDIDLTFMVRPKNTELKRSKECIVGTVEKLELKLANADRIMSRRRFNCYEVHFENLRPNNMLKEHLLIETFAHYVAYPVVEKRISNYIFEYVEGIGRLDLADLFSELTPFSMNVQSIERTCIDKLFAVMDHYIKGSHAGFSRHLYDLYKITQNIDLKSEAMRSLFLDVRTELAADLEQNPSASIEYPRQQEFLSLLELDFYKNDYETITSQLIHDNISYTTVKVYLIRLVRNRGFLEL